MRKKLKLKNEKTDHTIKKEYEEEQKYRLKIEQELLNIKTGRKSTKNIKIEDLNGTQFQ